MAHTYPEKIRNTIRLVMLLRPIVAREVHACSIDYTPSHANWPLPRRLVWVMAAMGIGIMLLAIFAGA